MKAIRIHEFGGTDKLVLDELEKPSPGPGEVLIKTAAAGINFADTALRKNKYLFTPELPFILGFEVAGTVEELGEGVSRLKVGQRVLATIRGGGYAEYATAHAQGVIPIPDGLGFNEATALLAQGLTAVGLLVDLQPGQTILIHAAAGGVGTLLVQLAKHRGAKVIGTASNAEKLKLVMELGADAAINYTESDWTDHVLEANGGKGVDVIIEMVGGELGKSNFKVLGVGGTMWVYGAASGEDFQISALGLLRLGQIVRGYNLNLEKRENVTRFAGELIGHIAAGRLKISVTEFPLSEAAKAHEAIESRQTVGKIVLTP